MPILPFTYNVIHMQSQNGSNNNFSNQSSSAGSQPILVGIFIVIVAFFLLICVHMLIRRMLRRRRLLQLSQNSTVDSEYVATDSAVRLFDDVVHVSIDSQQIEGVAIHEIDAAAPLFRVQEEGNKAQKTTDNKEDHFQEKDQQEMDDDDDDDDDNDDEVVDMEEDDPSLCAVCLDPLLPGQRARMLPCKHTYHDPCAVVWLVKANRCPVCSAQVVERPQKESQQLADQQNTQRDHSISLSRVHAHLPSRRRFPRPFRDYIR